MSNPLGNTIVTKEDYLEYYGIDLDVILTGLVVNSTGDSPSPRFIRDIELWCKRRYMSPPYDWDGKFIEVDPLASLEEQEKQREELEFQLQNFKDGVIQQINYVILKGKGSQYAFNTETMSIIPRGDLDRIGLCADSFNCFRMAGIANLIRR